MGAAAFFDGPPQSRTIGMGMEGPEDGNGFLPLRQLPYLGTVAHDDRRDDWDTEPEP